MKHIIIFTESVLRFKRLTSHFFIAVVAPVKEVLILALVLGIVWLLVAFKVNAMVSRCMDVFSGRSIAFAIK
jgi:hypothetical protein